MCAIGEWIGVIVIFNGRREPQSRRDEPTLNEYIHIRYLLAHQNVYEPQQAYRVYKMVFTSQMCGNVSGDQQVTPPVLVYILA
jgi:hypothetical protein